MRINNNIMALNAHRQLGVNQANSSKSMERLSSGMRINRAGDDAAGLAISEKMRGQIRGLKQAQRNAQDGISLIQTAEGALNEIHAILQRMRELATQSATDTNTEVDRLEIQKEIDQLAAEITRIADTTEFNTQNLLGGKFTAKFHIGANAGQNVELSINAMDANALKVAGSGEGLAKVETYVSGLESGTYTVATFVKDTHTPDAEWTTPPTFALLNADGDVVALGTGTDFYAIDDLELAPEGNAFGAGPGEVLEGVSPILTVATAVADGDEFEVKVDGGIDVSSQVAADKAITIINDALETVSAERSKLGAMQNRLEHTIANLGTSAENLQAAESRIRDLDMAEEIMAFTKNNILQQAATAMLAQANMAPQSVLQLLG